jgi:hypothetical protein
MTKPGKSLKRKNDEGSIVVGSSTMLFKRFWDRLNEWTGLPGRRKKELD